MGEKNKWKQNVSHLNVHHKTPQKNSDWGAW